MTLSTSLIPADVQRKLDVEDLCHRLLDSVGMDAYSEALNFCGGSGHGRIRAMQWQVVFQHLLVRRRSMCIRAQLDFYEVEKKAEAAVKRLKLEISPELSWLLVYAQTMKIVLGEPELWDLARATMSTWSTSS